MHRFTLAERAEIIKKYYRNSGSVVKTQREFRREVGRHHGFSVQAIRRTVEKFEHEYTLLNLKPPTRQRLVRNEENIAAVAASIEEDPDMSIRRRSAELGIARESTRLILRLDLGLHPYKIVLTQELKPDDHRQRREFANWALEMLAGDPDFGQKNHLLRRGPFLAQRLCQQAKLPLLERTQSTSVRPSINASTKIDCLVRFMAWRHHRTLFLSK
ncbi:PREDICTED: uncharacterized protein LOC105557670 [Vollenhovia emeryi]|uniref:uncharacterized protein LOC105557670 n=1 Tax=Vollenhovia emeryi TaxID=411798 RepID=UPI0005F52C66|nr:PREDICTED: uncharacterized protein LOC105557670 [Vollenhovia emeryi]XP_011860367.1 PREDICTED: uncharacterized protein LOC105557670 [Vollenhovia emeryi]XP_011860368.1 PREDICTED: uncharacterized protein LOC105557670 [Vollenhovia emeryi]